MEELKPCCFCKSKKVHVEVDYFEEYPVDPYFFVLCEKCCARGPVTTSEYMAIDAWNKRS